MFSVLFGSFLTTEVNETFGKFLLSQLSALLLESRQKFTEFDKKNTKCVETILNIN